MTTTTEPTTEPTTELAAPKPPPIDFQRLTLGEVAKIEELSGLTLDNIADDDSPKGKLLAAMAYVASRRRGSALTWDACLGLTVEEAGELIGEPPAPVVDDVDDVVEEEEGNPN